MLYKDSVGALPSPEVLKNWLVLKAWAGVPFSCRVSPGPRDAGGSCLPKPCCSRWGQRPGRRHAGGCCVPFPAAVCRAHFPFQSFRDGRIHFAKHLNFCVKQIDRSLQASHPHNLRARESCKPRRQRFLICVSLIRRRLLLFLGGVL